MPPRQRCCHTAHGAHYGFLNASVARCCIWVWKRPKRRLASLTAAVEVLHRDCSCKPGVRGGLSLSRQRLSILLCPLELKVRTPAHTKQLGWHLEFEFRASLRRRVAERGGGRSDGGGAAAGHPHAGRRVRGRDLSRVRGRDRPGEMMTMMMTMTTMTMMMMMMTMMMMMMTMTMMVMVVMVVPECFPSALARSCSRRCRSGCGLGG